jgi:D-hydroxyproline dehydrogenase
MGQQGRVAVIGAGVVGAAVAYALARQGQRVTLIDRMAPGFGGASFGNAGHIAAELVQPLPSPALLFGFWRMLFGFGGALDLSCRHAFGMLPWVARFARAAFMREANTRSLAPLVRPASSFWARWLGEIGHASLLRLNGHYEVAFGAGAAARMKALREAMGRLAIDARPMPAEALAPVQHAARAEHAAGLWFPDTAHVLDPLAVVRVLVGAATDRQARVKRLDVRALRTCGAGLEILSEEPPRAVDAAVICAGMGSSGLLAPFGLKAPLEAARGYHVELPGVAPLIDAPLLYADAQTVITPMTGRLRATGFMEFRPVDAPPDPRKDARLRRRLDALGYDCPREGPSWVGARPVLPDYLPGIGRAHDAPLFYAIGHQHIGLTLAPVTGELVADLVAGRTPPIPIAAFDLTRFNSHR